MAIRIQKRRGTAAAWTAANPILADGEEGYESDTKKLKIGDGVTAWSALSYRVSDPASVALTGGTIGGAAVTANSGLRQIQFAEERLARQFSAYYGTVNPHDGGTLATPPTVTSTSQSRPAGLTNEYKVADGTASFLRATGGRATFYGSGNRYQRFPVATFAATGGNTLNGTNGVVWRFAFRTNASQVSCSVISSTLPYRFIIADANGRNGRYVSTAGHTTFSTVGNSFFLLDFAGDTTLRTIIVEGQLDTGIDLVGCSPTFNITAVPTPNRRMLVLGDSITEGFGATLRGDGFAQVVGDLLGLTDVWCSGSGGTGYIATNTGASYALGTRLAQDAAVTTGPWDAIVVAMGVNDTSFTQSAITAAASPVLTTLRSLHPHTPIFVVGPWDQNSPSAPISGYTTCRAGILAAVPTNTPGIYFLDPQGVTYTKYDPTHPDTAGHQTLGAWLALQMKTVVGG